MGSPRGAEGPDAAPSKQKKDLPSPCGGFPSYSIRNICYLILSHLVFPYFIFNTSYFIFPFGVWTLVSKMGSVEGGSVSSAG